MGNPYKFLGKAVVKVDGKEFKLEDAEFTPSGVVREDIMDGQGFTEKEQGGSVTGKLYLNDKIDPTEINKTDDATVVFEADTGQSWSCPHAWHEQPEAISKDGMTVTFKFPKSEKIS